jgi:hypothetical protein
MDGDLKISTVLRASRSEYRRCIDTLTPDNSCDAKKYLGLDSGSKVVASGESGSPFTEAA